MTTINHEPTPCANCERLEDKLYHESRRADEVAYVKDGEIKTLQSKLDKACAALEDICHDQHLIGLDHQMAIWMFNRASDALEEIRKKDE